MRLSRSVVVVCAVVVAAGCLSVPKGTVDEILVVGSDTMLELDRRLAVGYMRKNPGDTVRVEGGGSGAGIVALLDGRAEIAAASRPLASDEVAAMHDNFGTLGVRYLIAQDALSVYVHDSNPVHNLSLRQLRGLFGGTVSDWSAVGGKMGKVVVIVRPPNSGTNRFFRDHVLSGAPYSRFAVVRPTTRGVLTEVRQDPAAIGYGGLAYRLEGVVQIAVEGVAPTPENVGRGRYPLTRFLAFYTTEPASGLARRFIDWCASAEGQQIVAEVGYIPLWKE